MQTAYDLVWMSGERHPDHLALVDDASDRRLSYRALLAEIDAVAAGLMGLGVRAGMKVATVLPSSFDHCLAILALCRLGAVPALINARLKPDEIAGLAAHGGLEGALVPSSPELVAAIAAALPDGAPLVAIGGAIESSLGDAVDFASLRGDPAGLPPRPAPDPEDPAFIFYSSGTTGLPKGIVLPHRASEARVVWLATQAGLRHGSHNRIAGLMPLAHAVGFFGGFLACLAFNGTFHLVTQFDPSAAVELIEREKISYLFAVPTIYHMLLAAPNFTPQKVASVELMLYGAFSMPAALQQRVAAAFPGALRHIYGTTETMNSLYHPEPLGRPTTLRPGFFSRLRVGRIGGAVNDLAAEGEEGELLIDMSAAANFTGYLNRPDADAEKIVDGWYRSADVVRRDDAGDYVLLGRVDDVINSGGERIHPEEVETVLAAHPGVGEVSVLGLPDEQWGATVVACVVPKDGARGAAALDARQLDARQLDAHCRDSALADYKRPRGYVFLDALPKTAANKVSRLALRETCAAARDGQGGIVFQVAGRH